MAGLPTGIVTLLLTEVVGSTARWEADAESMGRATAALDRTVAEIVRAHHGFVVKPRGEGDSHFTVFAEAADAVAAGAALLRAQVDLPIRVSVHTGPAELRDGDYYGPPVNRCARLRAAAHPGQGVVTAATTLAAGDRLPADLGLRPLGTHFFKDLAHPEDPYQIVGPGLEDEFPELASLTAPSHGLPLPLNAMIGRSAEVEALVEALNHPGTITVTGEAGVGKTRVALEAAALHHERFGGKAVELLDNVDAERDQVRSRLELAAGSGPTRLVTCRRALGLSQERVVAIQPLERGSARELLADRAATARPSLRIDDAEPADVDVILDACAGLPLAIELAGARLSMVTVAQLAQRLSRDPERVLTASSPRLPTHHASLRAARAWPDGS